MSIYRDGVRNDAKCRNTPGIICIYHTWPIPMCTLVGLTEDEIDDKVDDNDDDNAVYSMRQEL